MRARLALALGTLPPLLALGCGSGVYIASIQRLPLDAGLSYPDAALDAGQADASAADLGAGSDGAALDAAARPDLAAPDAQAWDLADQDLGGQTGDSPEGWAALVGADAPPPIPVAVMTSVGFTEATSAQDSDYLARLWVQLPTLVLLELSGGNPATSFYLVPADAAWQSLGYLQGYYASSEGTGYSELRPLLVPGNYFLRVYTDQGPRADYTLRLEGLPQPQPDGGVDAGLGEPAADSPASWAQLADPNAPDPLAVGVGFQWDHVEATELGDLDYLCRLTVSAGHDLLLLLEGGNASTDLYVYSADTSWQQTGTHSSTGDTGRRELRLSLTTGFYYVGVYSDEGPWTLYRVSIHALSQ